MEKKGNPHSVLRACVLSEASGFGGQEMKRNDNLHVTVIIPALNEELNIADVIRELNQTGYWDILIIDGNSIDKTVEVAKDFGVNVISQRGRGKGAALRQALGYDGLNGDVVVFMDADGSMNTKEIPLLVKALDSGADLVKGSRFIHGGYSEDMNVIRRIGNSFFVLLVNWFWSANYTDLCYGFGAFRKKSIKKLLRHLESIHFEIETEFFIRAKKSGLKVVEVPSIEFRRRHGKSNLNIFIDGFRILRTIVKELVKRH